jgi:RNA polymerase sigma factor (sigma-70 family)
MDDSDQHLLQTFARTRDGAVFAELVGRHSGMVFGVCRRVLGDRTLAEDAAQETFLHLLRQPAQVTGSLVGWLHRVAHGKAVDLVRREVAQDRHRKVAVEVQPPPAGQDEPRWTQISPLVDEALAEVDEEQRLLLIQHFLEGRGQEELARIHGMSQPTVSRRIAAGLATLRAVLERKGVVAGALLALGGLLQANACEAVPATLIAELGKMALASQVGLGAGAATAKAAAGAKLLGAKALIAAGVVAGGAALGTAALVRPSTPVQPTVQPAGLDWRVVGPLPPAEPAAAAPALPGDALASGGPLRLVTLATLGGRGDDEIVGVGIAPDHDLLIAGNTNGYAPAGVAATVLGADAPARGGEADRHGFIARLSPDGRRVLGFARFGRGLATIAGLKVGGDGDLLVLGAGRAGADLGAGPGPAAPFVARMTAAGRLSWICYRPDLIDAAAAGDEVVVLHGSQASRHRQPGGEAIAAAALATHGPDHAQAVAVERSGGTAVVMGFSMADVGGRRFRSPYAQAFTRSGAPAWTLWNSSGATARAAELIGDGMGRRAVFGADGVLRVLVHTDGGNTLLARDPGDPARPLDPAVHAGAHQSGPGYGFRGAHRLSGIFSVGPDGRLAKGSWLSSWTSPSQAASLIIEAICGDAAGRTIAVGGGADGQPQRAPWFADAGGKGGTIAVFDRGFALLQCGGFPGARFSAVAERDGWVVAGGRVAMGAGMRLHPAAPAATGPVDGASAGYVAVFRVGE